MNSTFTFGTRLPVSRLGRRFAAALFLLVFLLVAAIGVPAFFMIQDHIKRDISIALTNYAETYTQRIETSIEESFRIAVSLAANPLVSNALVDSHGRDIYLVPFLRQFQASNDKHIAIALADHKGSILAQEGQGALGWAAAPGWIKTLMDRPEPIVELFSRQGSLIFATPVIYGATGQTEGMVMVELQLSELVQPVPSGAERKLALWIENSDGIVLASNDHSRSPIFASHIRPISVRAGQEMLDMRLRVGEISEVALQPLEQFYIAYSLFGISFVLLTSFAAMIMISRLIQPIEELAAMAKKVAKGGQIQYDLPTRYNDELGDLARAFADMLRSLRDSQMALEERVAERTRDLLFAKQAAELANKAKSEFLSIVSHELRTPLTSINGALGLLNSGRMGEISDKGRNLLAIASTNSTRLIRIVNDILDFQKIEAGQMEFNFVFVDLHGILERSIESSRSYADQFGVRLRLDAAPGNAVVWADSERIIQVMNNLLSNAVKFSRQGDEVLVTIATTAQGYRVFVKDHGSGIPEKFRSRIFEKFAQADATSTRKVSGTGLGLSICKEIIERHRGSLVFDSEEGQGTTFAFELPSSPPSV